MNRMIATAFVAVLVAELVSSSELESLASPAALCQAPSPQDEPQPNTSHRSTSYRIVMRIEGLAAQGADRDWLPVQSLSLEAGPAIERLVIRKGADASSAEFLALCRSGATLPRVEVEYRRTDGSTESIVARYELVNAVVLASRSSVDVGSATLVALDELELSFEELEMTANEVDGDGKILNTRVTALGAR